jgi:DNA-directed RNA polymerase specialized sigma24 family protein
MPLDEVARVMDCPVGTVKSRIFRGKERLRELLKDYRQ